MIDLVRLALAFESAKKVLTRDDIGHHIPSLNKKGLVQAAITLANQHLEQSFGMVLIPAPAGSNLSTVMPVASNSTRRRQAVAQSLRLKDTTLHPTAAYMLISSLSSEERGLVPVRTLDPARLGFLKIVLVIIALSGGFIEHMDLRNALLDLNLFTSGVDPELGSFDALAAKFIKKKYIDRRRNPSDSSFVYGWGSRAFAEFPKEALVDIISDMAESSEFNQPKLDKHIASSLSSLDR